MHLLYKYIPLPGVFKLPAHVFSSHPFEKAEELLTALVARTHELPADRCVLDPDGEGRLSWRYPSRMADLGVEFQETSRCGKSGTLSLIKNGERCRKNMGRDAEVCVCVCFFLCSSFSCDDPNSPPNWFRGVKLLPKGQHRAVWPITGTGFVLFSTALD